MSRSHCSRMLGDASPTPVSPLSDIPQPVMPSYLLGTANLNGPMLATRHRQLTKQGETVVSRKQFKIRLSPGCQRIEIGSHNYPSWP